MRTITLPPGTERLYLEEIAHYIADAINPEGENDHEGVLYELGKVQTWDEAEQAAKEGALQVRHPSTHGPFPVGLNLRDNAVVLLSDAVAYFAERGMSVIVEEQLRPPAPPNAAHSTDKRWTAERLAALDDYRAKHTMPETAAKFGISEQRIRKLLPTGKAKPKTSTFPTTTHRIK